jgi:hypothetical protein
MLRTSVTLVPVRKGASIAEQYRSMNPITSGMVMKPSGSSPS